jgi:putative membrane protein
MSYLYIKAFHVIGVVAWFAGLFYIFRLYVYHTENRHNQEITTLLTVMEKRLYFGITWPAMALTCFMGAWLVFLNPELLAQNWFRLKLAAVACLLAYHFYAGVIRKKFLNGNYCLSSRQCRLINEVPTVILIIVVILVIVRPF